MREARTIQAIGWTIGCVLLLSGCIFAADPGVTSDPSATSDTGTIDTMSESNDSHTDGDGASSDEACNTDGDCPTRNHLEYVCSVGDGCVPDDCQTGWRDFDGDETNGCECDSDDIAAYYPDQDNDGYPERVGATESFCSDPGQGWAEESKPEDCAPEEAQIHPGFDDGGDWMCDRSDNDCDGEVDEACCNNADRDTEPEVVEFGTDHATLQPSAVGVTEADGAPSDATHLVAWATDDGINLQHIDRTGTRKEPEHRVGFDNPVVDLAVAATETGYALVVSTRRPSGPEVSPEDTASSIYAIEVPPDLNAATFTRTSAVEVKGGTTDGTIHEARRFDRLAVGAVGSRRLLLFDETTISYENGGTNPPVRQHRGRGRMYVGFQDPGGFEDGAISPLEGGLDANSEVFRPVVTTDGERFVAAWWNEGDEEIPVVGLTPSATGIGLEQRREMAFSTDSAPLPGTRKIGLAHIGGEKFAVVYPFAQPSSGDGSLKAGRVVFGREAGQSEPFLLAEPEGYEYREPSLLASDTTGDGSIDRLSVAWFRSGGNSGFQLQVTGMPGLGEIDETTSIGVSETDWHSLTGGGRAAGLLWRSDPAVADDDLRFVPLSGHGPAICPSAY